MRRWRQPRRGRRARVIRDILTNDASPKGRRAAQDIVPLPDVVDAPPRRERAGDRAPPPVPTATPVKISGQYRFLDDVVSVLPIIRTPEVPIALPFEVLTTLALCPQTFVCRVVAQSEGTAESN